MDDQPAKISENASSSGRASGAPLGDDGPRLPTSPGEGERQTSDGSLELGDRGPFPPSPGAIASTGEAPSPALAAQSPLLRELAAVIAPESRLTAEVLRLRQAAAESADDFAGQAWSPGTVKTYKAALRLYDIWCRDRAYEPINGDPATLRAYIADMAKAKSAVSTLRVAVAAVKLLHDTAGVPFDATDAKLRATLRGIAAKIGVKPRRQAAPVKMKVLKAMLNTLPPTKAGIRDRAIMLIGFGGALRRSEISALKIGDITIDPAQGLAIAIGRSKTDQEGQGALLGVSRNDRDPSLCPVLAFQHWLDVRETCSDFLAAAASERPKLALFCNFSRATAGAPQGLHPETISSIVKVAAEQAGLKNWRSFTGHSLRAGLITSAAEEGATLSDIANHSRHKSIDMVNRYVRHVTVWDNNITQRVFQKK